MLLYPDLAHLTEIILWVCKISTQNSGQLIKTIFSPCKDQHIICHLCINISKYWDIHDLNLSKGSD